MSRWFGDSVADDLHGVKKSPDRCVLGGDLPVESGDGGLEKEHLFPQVGQDVIVLAGWWDILVVE